MTDVDKEGLAVLLKGVAVGSLVVGFGGLVIAGSVVAVIVACGVAFLLNLASAFVESSK